jgi:virginiamycin A acetyltransferase
VVGHDVWIGMGATIMPGVKIVDGPVVAARSVVTRDIEPYAVVGGNSAKAIKKRFSEEVVA